VLRRLTLSCVNGRPTPWVLVIILLSLAAGGAISSVLSANRFCTSTSNRHPISAAVLPSGLSSRIDLPGRSFTAGQTIAATLVVTDESNQSFDLARYCQMNDTPIVLTNREISAGLQAVSDLMCHPLHVVLHPGLDRIRFAITNDVSRLRRDGTGEPRYPAVSYRQSNASVPARSLQDRLDQFGLTGTSSYFGDLGALTNRPMR
jgi:hypothetical protein